MTLQEALKKLNSGYCPSGLYLKLSDEKITALGAQALAEALVSGKCPSGLQLSLFENNIGDEGAQALAQALSSGKCPSGLKLDLWRNNSGDKGAQAFADALASGHCPSGLHLVLCSNGITDLGAQAFADAVNTGNCRFGTKIDLKKNEYDIAELSRENDVIIHQAALGIAILVGGFLQDNMRVRTSPQSRLPLDVIDNISKFLPGHISAIKIAAYLKKSFIHLMKTNSEYSQKHRSNNPVNQHLYDKQHGLSLWKCNEHRRKKWLKNHQIMIQRQIPIHSFK